MADTIKVDGQVVAKTDLRRPELHHIYNSNKEGHYFNAYCNLW